MKPGWIPRPHRAPGSQSRSFVDAIAPTNFVGSNPAALRKLADTKGASVIRGFANFVEDLASGRCLPRQVDARPFTVGRNVATTPRRGRLRNELLELIQYAPTTPDVHARPLLIVPPQINKYYVFDLAAGQEPRPVGARRAACRRSS